MRCRVEKVVANRKEELEEDIMHAFDLFRIFAQLVDPAELLIVFKLLLPRLNTVQLGLREYRTRT